MREKIATGGYCVPNKQSRHRTQKIQNTFAIIIYSTLGSFLEFYELGLYGIYFFTLAEYFFPYSALNIAPFLSLTIFALGFMGRSLGAVIYGHMGDRLGTPRVLPSTIMLMGFSTFTIGIVPGYETLGAFSPIIFFICRVVQGIATGGEYNGASIFLTDHFKKYPGLVSGLTCAAGMMGALSALVFVYITLLLNIPKCSWHIPFIFGLFIGVAGYIFRSKMLKSDSFREFIKEDSPCPISLHILIQSHWTQFLRAVGVGGYRGAWIIMVAIHFNFFLRDYLSIDTIFLLGIYGCLVKIFGDISFGFLADRYQISKMKIMRYAALSTFVSIYYVFYLSTSCHLGELIVGTTMLAVLSSGFSSCSNAVLYKLFPKDVRHSSVSCGYSLGIIIFGGTTPLISHLMVEYTGNNFSPSYYLMGLSLVGYAACYRKKHQ